ncbi:uncharacterized protein LOC132975800 [Labrus mixtus]|uniref:uncharacterized protein LOC132975800 n=1 Tax=Labrus mixtus TaxID=508554 RepID=UPI0029BFB878|nr:uncharacterized protein LOC132975800 [Labrus mixtus]
MAATAAVNRPPPAHPGPHAGNLHSQPTSGVPNSGFHDPGLQGISQDPRLQHPHVSSRPVFYVPVQPPPPFLHYQWPMPFSYNPFSGFPGMGYGMVMPPFPPPPPYMEAPSYVLPNPHIQPVDYRHLLHPSVHAPAAPYQHLNQPRRVRPPYPVPVRQTVNAEVQTEPTGRGGASSGEVSPLISSDSGHGTTSNSPSSSSSHKRGSAEPQTFTRDFNKRCESSAVTQRFNLVHPAGTKTLQSRHRDARQPPKSPMRSVEENLPPCRDAHHNMWSVGSSGGMVPVCSSSQQDDDVIKERRESVPDIIMSWATPRTTMLKPSDKLLPENEQQQPSCEAENEKSAEQRGAVTKSAPVVSDTAADNTEALLTSQDSEPLFKILRLPGTLHKLLSEAKRVVELPSTDELLLSLNQSERLPDNEPENETTPHSHSTELIPYQMSSNSFQMKRKLNESVWSVESLPSFIPNKEWLQQNGVFEPDVIVEMIEQEDDGGPLTQNEHLRSQKDRRRSRRFSSSDSVLMSDSWLLFSTPAEKLSQSKKTETEGGMDSPEGREQKRDQSTTPSEKVPSASPPRWQSALNVSSPPKENADENRSSEPEANQSPNQECFLVTEQTERSPRSREQEKPLPTNSAEEEKTLCQLIPQHGADVEVEERACVNAEESERRDQQLCVPEVEHTTAAVSPSKGHLVDCGVQCSELTDRKCPCEESSTEPNKRPHFNDSDVKKMNNNKTEGYSVNGQMSKNQRRNAHWRNRGQENQNGQWDPYNGFCGRPGRSKGGNRRALY